MKRTRALIPQFQKIGKTGISRALSGASQWILKGCPLLDRAMHGTFYTRKMKWSRRYDLRWWNRLEATLARELSKN
jgi:hypothetical protein